MISNNGIRALRDEIVHHNSVIIINKGDLIQLKETQLTFPFSFDKIVNGLYIDEDKMCYRILYNLNGVLTIAYFNKFEWIIKLI